MSKRIAFCADGTWDKAASHTNVFKISQAVAKNANQVTLYDNGVGADGNRLEMFIGGAFGTGLWNKIKQGYKEIAKEYRQGDDIFIFGFSRGAYTARSLAGMIAFCGLPTANVDKDNNDLVNMAFDAYRERIPDERKKKLEKLAFFSMFPADIKMIGVWDTVGALGIPSFLGFSDPVVYGFLDTSLNPKIKNAFHAMAIDERRAQFMPTLWTGAPGADQHVEQVWFTGAHSDVGGGEPDDVAGTTALSDISLSWIIDKARSLGLEFDEAVAKMYTPPLDWSISLSRFHESWKPLNGIPLRRHIPANANLANSVAVRCTHDPEWRPANLTLVNGVPGPTYKITQVVKDAAATSAAQGS